MQVTLEIDDELLNEACKLGKHRHADEAVAAALRAYVERRGRQGLVDLFGTIDYDEDYDYKAARSGRRQT